MTGGGLTKDFFVSYTGADVAWAQWIAWILEEAGHTVHLQAWDFVPGSNWVAQMQEGTQAERTVVVLSKAYVTGSEFGAAEWQAAFRDDPQGAKRKLIPIQVEDCDRPGLLGQLVSFDVFGVDEASAKKRVLDGIAAALSGRAKPAHQPSFPGGAAKPATKAGAPFPGDVSRIWNVPPRNPNFTGRAKELESLRAGLTSGSNVVVQSVHGMGGLGKTQLAVEYAYRYAAAYDLVWFVATEQASLLADQFGLLSAALGLEPSTDPEVVRLRVQAALAGVPRWLLIFDNAELVAEVRPWIPAQPIAAGQVGHVVLTSRRSGFGSVGSVLDLDVISTDEAVDLLRTRIVEVDAATAGRIANVLGHLPLALEQAAAYLDQTQLPPGEYASLIETRQPEMLDRGRDQQRGETTVATLWQLSLDRLAEIDPAAVQLIKICAQLAPEPVPLDLFAAHPEKLPTPLREAASDPLAFTDVVASLTDYSLVRRGSQGLTFHRLVLAAVRSGMSPAELDQTLARAAELLRADLPGEIITAPETWVRWAECLPHALAVGAAVAREQGLKDASDDGSWLLDRAGTYLQVHGRPQEAKPLMESAVAIVEASYGTDFSKVAANLNNLATVLQDLGDAAGARPLLERALRIEEAAFGVHHPRVAKDLSDLAMVLRDLGDAAGAQPLAERALKIDEATFGDEHPTVAIRLNNLALVFQSLGDAAGARPLLERALRIDEATYGASHPAVAIRLSNLATVLRDLGDAAGARPLVERALRIDEATYGTDHPTVAIRLSNLAVVLQDLGETAGARPLLAESLRIARAVWGDDHPNSRVIQQNLVALGA